MNQFESATASPTYTFLMAFWDGVAAFIRSPTLIILWMGLWWNLNSGYWVLRDFPSSPGISDLIEGTRAAMPWIVLTGGLFTVYALKNELRGVMGRSATFSLMIYGAIAFFSSNLSTYPLAAFYFGAAFVAVLICSIGMGRFIRSDLIMVRPVLMANWIVTSFIALTIVYTARDLLLAPASESAYAVILEVDEKTRSSGAARFCAVPAVVALSRFVFGRGVWRLVWIPIFIFFLQLIFKLESRGAIFGVLFSTAFVWLIGRGLSRSLIFFGLLAGAVSFFDPDLTIIERAVQHIQRGQTEEEFKSMTGRTHAWEKAIALTRDSPLLEQMVGRGNWADRMLIDEHVHNTFLQALMLGGVIGFGFFVWSWVRAWRNFWFAYQRRDGLSPPDRYMLLEAAAVFAFFTVRSIPETTNASFSVDLLVMAPIMVYFDVLSNRLRHPPPLPPPMEEEEIEEEVEEAERLTSNA